MAINNRGYGLYQRFVYFYEVAKSFGFCFGQEKNKSKQKDFAMS